MFITIIFNSWDCDRVAWKFYYDPQVFKSLGRGTHEKKISGGDHYDVNISHDRF